MGSLKVIHFVTGGFSGSTSVAIELVKASLGNPQFESLLVLRRKKAKHDKKIQQLRDQEIPVECVTSWSSIATIFALVKICRQFKPDIIVCHGFSEHLWGRYAGLIAGVPHLIHVEHNSRERYTPWRLFQARWLARYTDKIVGCSEGVRQELLRLKFPAEKTITINNGINLLPYDPSTSIPLRERENGIVMAARFAKQKDHLTLIKAVALLREKNMFPPLYLAGAGSKKHIKRAKKLVKELQLKDQVKFLGFSKNVPELLAKNKVCVLATHYEGMPLSVCEGMASGCVVVGSDVVGVGELIQQSVDGLLATPNSPESLANSLHIALVNSYFTDQLAKNAQARAMQYFSLDRMVSNYENLFLSLIRQPEAVFRESLFY
ncbi:glycosyl transferase [Cellvibrio zantedeschiae]|uniref:Glycosyl transferase n=1 Tax=Cellvibrio zantedeschiae TaxID=1237077 RepID=A0ABQ3B7V4_9GAMM|nr:glycosyltransferase [Cellvibrio zantedeschiae]GGY77920.1 glycosyl transferase [Cellvibrio zantedeschiae]